MSLPESFIAEGLELAKGASLFGVLIETMTRDELIASAAKGWKRADFIREQAEADRNILFNSMRQ